MNTSINWYEDPLLVYWNESSTYIPCIGVHAQDSEFKVFASKELLDKEEHYKEASIAQITQAAAAAFKNASKDIKQFIPTIAYNFLELKNSQKNTNKIKQIWSKLTNSNKSKENEQELSSKIFGVLCVDALREAIQNDEFGWAYIILHQMKSIECIEKINDVDKEGNTPLHLAVKLGRTHIVQSLINIKQININAQNNDGETPIYLAMKNHNKKIVNLIINEKSFDVCKGSKGGTTIFHDIIEHSAGFEKYLLIVFNGWKQHQKNQSSLSLNMPIFKDSEYGRTPLQAAANNGNTEACKFIINNPSLFGSNENIYCKDNEGRTVLHLATENGNEELIKIFIDFGGERLVSQRDKHLKKARSRALNSWRSEDIIELFPVEIKPSNVQLHEALNNLTHFANFISSHNYFSKDGEPPLSYLMHSKKAKEGFLLILDTMREDSVCSEDPYLKDNIHNRLETLDERVHEMIQIRKDRMTFEQTFQKHHRAKLTNLVKYINLVKDLIFIFLQGQELRKAVVEGDLKKASEMAEILTKPTNLTKEWKVSATMDRQGNNALHLAAQSGKLDICLFLLQHPFCQSFIISKNNIEQLPVHIAAQQGNFDLFMRLFLALKVEFSKINSTLPIISDSDNTSLLHLSAEGGHLDICRYLIRSNNEYVNVRDNRGCSPIHGAAKNGHVETVKLLLDELFKGCDENILKISRNSFYSVWRTLDNIKGKTPLHLAAEFGHYEVCLLILKHPFAKRIFNFLDDKLRSPIHSAVENGHFKVVELLLNELFIGQDESVLNITRKKPGSVWEKLDDNKGNTPLHIAASKGNLEICNLFIKHRSAFRLLNFVNSDDQTPFHLAAEEGYIKIYELFHECFKYTTYLSLLIDDRNRTPLHLAALNGKHEMCDYLTKLYDSSFVSIQDNSGETALHIASRKGNEKSVEMIISKDSEKIIGFMRDKDGRSARQYAHNKPKILKLIENYCPTMEDVKKAFIVLETSLSGIRGNIKDKAPEDTLLANFQVLKSKLQLIIEAIFQQPAYEKVERTFVSMYQDISFELYDKVKRRQTLNEKNKLMIESMAKELSAAKLELFPKTQVQNSTVAFNSASVPYVVEIGYIGTEIDRQARELYNKYPVLIKSMEKTLTRIQIGEFSKEIQDLLEELSEDVISQNSILSLIFLHVLQTSKFVKGEFFGELPEIFTQHLKKIQFLNVQYEDILKDPVIFKRLAAYLINARRNQSNFKLSEEDTKEFQKEFLEIEEIVTFAIGRSSLSQKEFSNFQRCYFQIFMGALDSEQASDAIQLHIANHSFFQAELLVNKMSDSDPLKRTAILNILNAYLRNELWNWAESFVNRIAISEEYLALYFLNRFKFLNEERIAGINHSFSDLNNIWKKIAKTNVADQVQAEIETLGEDAVEFFATVILLPD